MPKRRTPAIKVPPPPERNRIVRSDVRAFAVILCATLAAYLPALSGSRLWDDSNYLIQPELQSLHGLWRLWFDLSLGATRQYYPLLDTAFWFEHVLWGDALLGYHLTNVVLHSLSAFLVVLIVRRLKLPGAWLAGLIFGLHPVCVESVAWITEQKNTLSGVFYFAAALTYLHFDRTRQKSKYLLALGLFFLALASKSATVPLPAVLLVVLWWLRGRLEWRRDVRPLLPWFGLAVCSGLLTRYVEKVYIGAEGAAFTLSLPQHLLLAGRTPWFYASKLLWPVDLIFYYPRWDVDPGEWWQYLFPLGLLSVVAAFVWLARRNRGPLASLLIFVGTLFPVLGFLSVFYFRYSYVSDHFEYLASLGIVIPLAAAATALAQRWKLGKPWPVVLSSALLICLAILTWRQSSMYTDVETLYRETLARNPDSSLAHINLGNVLFNIPGQRDEATAHFLAAIRANPDNWEAHLSLGNVFLDLPDRLDDAIAEFRTAVRMAPNSVRSHTNLGIALIRADRTAEAIEQFETAVRLQPDSALPHSNLAAALSHVPGRLPEAVSEYQVALRAKPDFARAHDDLGHVLAMIPGRLPEAIAEFQTAIRLEPNSWEAHNNLATAFLHTPGRLPDAVAEYQAALRTGPDSPSAHSNLAYALLQMPGRQAEALAEYEAALRLKPSPELEKIVERLRAAKKP